MMGPGKVLKFQIAIETGAEDGKTPGFAQT